MQNIEHHSCRVCGGELEVVFNAGNYFVSTFLLNREDPGTTCPLILVRCLNKNCELTQLKHTAPQELMYTRKYWYRSGINEVIVNDLKEIVGEAMDLVKTKDGDIFLDIGANDGTLLSFVPKTFKRFAVEPAENFTNTLFAIADIVAPEFWNIKLMGGRKAKIISSIGMFYDSEDPNQFVGDMKLALDENGIIVAQLMTLWPMLEQSDLGNICHEHLEYFSYKSLVYLFEKNGLEIFKVKKNLINGGSYRIFARHFKNGSIEMKEKEPDFELFKNQIELNKLNTVQFIKNVVSRGAKVYGYGASTKGNTLLQYYDLTPDLICAVADRNPEKWGKYMVGTGIPIISEKEARERADFFFILPYAFLNQFVEREQEWREKGGKFIICTPRFAVL